MHGLIIAELHNFVVAKFGNDAWKALLKEAGIRDTRRYFPILTYPDEEVLSLVGTASRLTGIDAQLLLEDFGQFIVPSLLDVYGIVIPAGWKMLDVLEHTEDLIHQMVRKSTHHSSPPFLECRRTSDNEVVIVYKSQRRLCAVARGILKGFGERFRENIHIVESTCQQKGHSVCTIAVTAAGTAIGAARGRTG